MSFNVNNSYHHYSLHSVLNMCCLIQIKPCSRSGKLFRERNQGLTWEKSTCLLQWSQLGNPSSTQPPWVVVFLQLYQQRKKFNQDCVESLASLVDSYSSKQENMGYSCYTEMPLGDRLVLILEMQLQAYLSSKFKAYQSLRI